MHAEHFPYLSNFMYGFVLGNKQILQ